MRGAVRSIGAVSHCTASVDCWGARRSPHTRKRSFVPAGQHPQPSPASWLPRKSQNRCRASDPSPPSSLPSPSPRRWAATQLVLAAGRSLYTLTGALEAMKLAESPAVAACCLPPAARVQDGAATPSAAAPSPAKLLKRAAAGDVAAAKDSADAVPAAAARSPAAVAAVQAPAKSVGSKAAKPKPKAAAAAAPPSGEAAVGLSVKVYWKDDDAWYTGDIQGERAWGRVEWSGRGGATVVPVWSWLAACCWGAAAPGRSPEPCRPACAVNCLRRS